MNETVSIKVNETKPTAELEVGPAAGWWRAASADCRITGDRTGLPVIGSEMTRR